MQGTLADPKIRSSRNIWACTISCVTQDAVAMMVVLAKEIVYLPGFLQSMAK
jgi:hypothetical protein